jgi:hypothetical protein
MHGCPGLPAHTYAEEYRQHIRRGVSSESPAVHVSLNFKGNMAAEQPDRVSCSPSFRRASFRLLLSRGCFLSQTGRRCVSASRSIGRPCSRFLSQGHSGQLPWGRRLSPDAAPGWLCAGSGAAGGGAREAHEFASGLGRWSASPGPDASPLGLDADIGASE